MFNYCAFSLNIDVLQRKFLIGRIIQGLHQGLSIAHQESNHLLFHCQIILLIPIFFQVGYAMLCISSPLCFLLQLVFLKIGMLPYNTTNNLSFTQKVNALFFFSFFFLLPPWVKFQFPS